ncbi:MAG: urease accessory protein UreE [Bauldia sp.]|nr:urease accessory protein UreE [Bauldia sp.]
MHVATEIIGNITDPGMGGRLHRLDHSGGLETVALPRADLARRRLKALTDKGTPIAVALPRSQRLFDGAILVLGEDRAVIVRVEPEAWLRLRPADSAAALAVGYHAGNLHWRVGFDGGDLLVALEHDEKQYRDRLADLVEGGRVRIIETGPAAEGVDA